MPPKKEPDNIRVFLRVRPTMGREIAEHHTTNNLTFDADKTLVKVRRRIEEGKTFNFHEVFKPDTSQEKVYNTFAKDAVDHAINGYHGVLFVYGQTGSGKTFTMSNEEPGQEGMLQRAMRDLWDHVESDTEHDYSISVSYVQLYNELLTDMLETKNNAVRLSGFADRKTDIRLINEESGASIEREVNTYEETLTFFKTGLKHRAQSSTNMNAQSSRSHTVFSVHINKAVKATAAGNTDANRKKVLDGRLIICDLAGSERVGKTGAVGKQLLEATNINNSLLVLGRVVAALTDRKKGAQHVPFRESKLTRLLQYSLSGWGKTSIVVNVSPSDDNTEETISAINFGQRAIQIKQQAEQHQTHDWKAMYEELLRDLDRVRDETTKQAYAQIESSQGDRVRELEEKVKMLEDELAMVKAGIATPRTPSAASPSAATTLDNPVQSISAASDGNPLHALVNGRTVKDILIASRAAVAHRDEHLAQLRESNEELTKEIASKKEACMTLAVKLKTMQLRAIEREEQQQALIDDLQIRLAETQDTEYMADRGGGDIVERVEQLEQQLDEEQASPDEATVDALDTKQMERMSKMIRAISQLKGELTDQILYNERARFAIKKLHGDLQAARSRK